jgi:hypothetical protein
VCHAALPTAPRPRCVCHIAVPTALRRARRFSKAILATNARLRAAAAANQTCARFLDCNAVFLEPDKEVRPGLCLAGVE